MEKLQNRLFLKFLVEVVMSFGGSCGISCHSDVAAGWLWRCGLLRGKRGTHGTGLGQVAPQLFSRNSFTHRPFTFNFVTHISFTDTTLSHTTLLPTTLSYTLAQNNLCELWCGMHLTCKTLQLHLTGMGRWKDPRKDREETIAKVNARWNKLTDCDNSAENCPLTYRALSRNLSSTISFVLPAFPINFHISVVLIGRSWHVRFPVFLTLVPKPL